MMDQSADTVRHGRVGYGRLARFTPVILAGIMGVAIVFIALNERDKEANPRDMVGQPAPNVSLIDFETAEVRPLSSYAGSVVVLNFWASWCTPCLAEMPAFQAVHADGENDVTIIGVNIKNDRPDDAREMLAETGVQYEIAIDSGGENQVYGLVEQSFGVGGSYPVTIFIRPTGEIDAIRIGELDESQIRDGIEEARS
jgi:thiol-disulfide isomerase/thioredoxin